MLLVAEKYPWIKEELEAVRTVMNEALNSTYMDMGDEIKNIMSEESDLLRAMFVIIASQFGNYDSEYTVHLAAVIELIYLSAKLQIKGFIKYGDLFSSAHLLDKCFAGNYLLAESMSLMADKLKLKESKVILDCYKRLTAIEHRYLSQRYILHNSKRTYIRHMKARSGSIFEMCFNVGAMQSCNDEDIVRRLTKIGYHLGLARQLIDDLLDIDREQEIMGKTIGHNIVEGIYSLPIYYLSKKLPEETNKLLLKKPFRTRHLNKLIKLMREEGAIDKTRRLAQTYTRKVYLEINSLPSSEYKQVMFDTASSILERRF